MANEGRWLRIKELIKEEHAKIHETDQQSCEKWWKFENSKATGQEFFFCSRSSKKQFPRPGDLGGASMWSPLWKSNVWLQLLVASFTTGTRWLWSSHYQRSDSTTSIPKRCDLASRTYVHHHWHQSVVISHLGHILTTRALWVKCDVSTAC